MCKQRNITIDNVPHSLLFRPGHAHVNIISSFKSSSSSLLALLTSPIRHARPLPPTRLRALNAHEHLASALPAITTVSTRRAKHRTTAVLDRVKRHGSATTHAHHTSDILPVEMRVHPKAGVVIPAVGGRLLCEHVAWAGRVAEDISRWV
jgi:hypothetical protein